MSRHRIKRKKTKKKRTPPPPPPKQAPIGIISLLFKMVDRIGKLIITLFFKYPIILILIVGPILIWFFATGRDRKLSRYTNYIKNNDTTTIYKLIEKRAFDWNYIFDDDIKVALKNDNRKLANLIIDNLNEIYPTHGMVKEVLDSDASTREHFFNHPSLKDNYNKKKLTESILPFFKDNKTVYITKLLAMGIGADAELTLSSRTRFLESISYRHSSRNRTKTVRTYKMAKRRVGAGNGSYTESYRKYYDTTITYKDYSWKSLPLPIYASVSELQREARSLDISNQPIKTKWTYHTRKVSPIEYAFINGDDETAIQIISNLQTITQKQQKAGQYLNFTNDTLMDLYQANREFELLKDSRYTVLSNTLIAKIHQNRRISKSYIPQSAKEKRILLEYVIISGSYKTFESLISQELVEFNPNDLTLLDELVQSKSPKILRLFIERGLSLYKKVKRKYLDKSLQQKSSALLFVYMGETSSSLNNEVLTIYKLLRSEWLQQKNLEIALDGFYNNWPQEFYSFAFSDSPQANDSIYSLRDREGKTVLHITSLYGNEKGIISILQKAPHLINVQTQKNQLAISYAALRGEIDIVDRLLNSGSLIPNGLAVKVENRGKVYRFGFNTNLKNLYREIGRMIAQKNKAE